MNDQAPERAVPAEQKLSIIDVDIHPKTDYADLKPYLGQRWWDHLQTFGTRQGHGFQIGFGYPKGQPQASRRDSWPPGGGLPASNLDFMRKQYLDAYPIEYAMMLPLSPTGQGEQNEGFAIAMATAANEFQVEGWHARDKRQLPAIVVPYENAQASRAEIRRRAADKRFVQVMFRSRTYEAMGKKRYWPIYEAAVEAGRPVAVHVFGTSSRAPTSTGWPSYYIEDMAEHACTCQTHVTSLILEGVFEAFPDLKVVMVEGGFGWMPSLGWRLDQCWKRLKSEVPHLKMAPSEYLRRYFWVSTQPMEEPERPEQLIDLMEWIGWDRIMYSSDYPHWDFDDPLRVFPREIPADKRAMIYAGNARKLYGLG
jgi:predicted TIM-barrel fold metal-dependent hydrolase